MKVLLINTNTMKPLIAPIGLEYVTGNLRKNSIEVDIYDISFNSEPLSEAISRIEPDFIGITVRNTDDCVYPSGGYFLSGIKGIIDKIKKLTDAVIIAGGIGVSIMPEEVIRYLDIDFGIRGDGEDAFLKFLKNYPETRNTPNLIYRNNGSYKKTETAYFNLDGFNPPRNIFDNRKYFELGGMGSIETKRGCNRKCIYCADPLCKGEKMRLRNPDSIADELNRLLKDGINIFHFCDSEFNIPYAHACKICGEIIRKKINKKISWYCYCAPVKFDLELAQLMHAAGCAGINFGVDSTDDEILISLGRRHTIEDLYKVSNVCRKTGIIFMFDLMLGSPGENANTLRRTLEDIKKINPDVIGSTIGVRLYPGTKISKMVLAEGELRFNRNLHGALEKNENLLMPVFFISEKIAPNIFSILEKTTAGDKRFLFSHNKDSKGYNYNENIILVEAIQKGYRGAYWDILRKLVLGTPH